MAEVTLCDFLGWAKAIQLYLIYLHTHSLSLGHDMQNPNNLRLPYWEETISKDHIWVLW